MKITRLSAAEVCSVQPMSAVAGERAYGELLEKSGLRALFCRCRRSSTVSATAEWPPIELRCQYCWKTTSDEVGPDGYTIAVTVG